MALSQSLPHADLESESKHNNTAWTAQATLTENQKNASGAKKNENANAVAFPGFVRGIFVVVVCGRSSFNTVTVD